MSKETVIFEKEYPGYESSYNILEDVEGCFSTSHNALAESIPDEFKGTIKIRISYEETCNGNSGT